jgi:osmotically inducible protein OsmC
MATRNGSAEWKGDLPSGSGQLTVGDGVFSGAYSFSSRFEEGEGTNPEELIAGAHAACYAMALPTTSRPPGTHRSRSTPPRGCTCATSTARRQSRRSTSTSSASCPAGRGGFQEAAEQAKVNCPVSRALASVPRVNLNAKLA